MWIQLTAVFGIGKIWNHCSLLIASRINVLPSMSDLEIQLAIGLFQAILAEQSLIAKINLLFTSNGEAIDSLSTFNEWLINF